MSVQPLSTPSAPPAVGPYSPAVRAGDWIACSGQVGLDPATGELVDGGIEEQTRRVVANCANVLRDVGADPTDVAKTTVFLTDMASFAAMNAIYGSFFGDHKPARSTVAVSGLPKGGGEQSSLRGQCRQHLSVHTITLEPVPIVYEHLSFPKQRSFASAAACSG